MVGSTGPDTAVVDGEVGTEDDGEGSANLGSGSSPEQAPSASTGTRASAVRAVRDRITSPIIPRSTQNRNGPVAICG
jgi:hypothetical protein